MLRTERPRIALTPTLVDQPHTMARDLLIAMAPPPRTHVYDLTGWPSWLIPTFRSGAQRLASRSREGERRS
ncbi:MAG TPA: hypothetical protein VEL82_08820 [Thermoplasmata archaeon]|nr:hypothetical protein [Thermoplasmata archaeon]